MNKISGLFVALVVGAVMVVSVSAYAAVLGPSNEPNGVYCQVNEVRLFAESAEDCEKAGGSVTHTVTTTVESADDDNPD